MAASRRNRRLPPRLLPCLSILRVNAHFDDEIVQIEVSDDLQFFQDFNWADRPASWSGFNIDWPGGNQIVSVFYGTPTIIGFVMGSAGSPGLVTVTIPPDFGAMRGAAGGVICGGNYLVEIVEPV